MQINKFLVVLIAIMLSSTILAGDTRVNFSGEWSLNEGKSQLGEGRGRMVAAKLLIVQKGNDLSIERTYQRQYEDDTVFQEILTLDGKECKNTFRDSPRISVAKWSEDGKMLTITSKMTFDRGGNKVEINSTEVWSLKENGKVLAIDFASKSPRGERKGTYIYDKDGDSK